MSVIATKDIVPISRARARLTELAEDVSKTGHEKVFTKNGESYVALITAGQLDDYRRFREAEHLRKSGLNFFGLAGRIPAREHEGLADVSLLGDAERIVVASRIGAQVVQFATGRAVAGVRGRAKDLHSTVIHQRGEVLGCTSCDLSALDQRACADARA